MAKKQLFTLEYAVRCSPTILYNFLSTPSGLQEWFADLVNERDKMFVFSWNNVEEKAVVVEAHQDKSIRFHWINSPKDEYFEFEIDTTEITSQTVLLIRDFADKKDIKDQKQLWEYQVRELLHRLGN